METAVNAFPLLSKETNLRKQIFTNEMQKSILLALLITISQMFGSIRAFSRFALSRKSFLSTQYSAKEAVCQVQGASKLENDVIQSPVIVGIAGGSACGKTTMADSIIKALGEEHISVIGHDSYYKCLNHITLEERAKFNFDHPDSLDTQLLIDHIKQLKKGRAVAIPSYDFSCHTRTADTNIVTPRKIILLDGILIFSEQELLNLIDLKIFIDTADDVRLIRRIGRDTKERGRSMESVIEQYLKTVRPMHELYVEPSKRRADIIVPAGDGISPAALDMCISRLREIISV